jgi:hypothetical protein
VKFDCFHGKEINCQTPNEKNHEHHIQNLQNKRNSQHSPSLSVGSLCD